MVTAPLAVASSDTSSCSSPLPTSGTSLASTSTLFLLDVREEDDPVTLDTVTRPDGLGESFSLEETHKAELSWAVRGQQNSHTLISLFHFVLLKVKFTFFMCHRPERVFVFTCAPLLLEASCKHWSPCPGQASRPRAPGIRWAERSSCFLIHSSPVLFLQWLCDAYLALLTEFPPALWYDPLRLPPSRHRHRSKLKIICF